MLQDAQDNGEQNFAQFRSEVNDLRKFVVLNYLAVIKAFKKRNRHLQVTTPCPNYPITKAIGLLQFANSIISNIVR